MRDSAKDKKTKLSCDTINIYELSSSPANTVKTEDSVKNMIVKTATQLKNNPNI